MTASTPYRDAIEKIAKDVSRQIHDYARDLDLVFVPHAPGRHEDALSLVEPSLHKHPAGMHVRRLLRNAPANGESGLYGLSLHTKKLFLGLMRRTSALGLATINTEEFSSTDEAKRTMYHYAWHALDLMAARRRPQFRGKFDEGPMIPKRNAVSHGRANLRADTFAAAMMAFQGRTGEARALGAERSRQSLEARPGRDPALFPYPVAAESAHLVIAEMAGTSFPKSRLIPLALETAADVGATIDERLLRQWQAFCASAQDMAWRGYDPERILGAAIHASEDPYVRSIGYLVSEATGITPLSAPEIKKGYNAFAEAEANARAHREAGNEVFAEAVAQVAFEKNSSPFIAAANAQNHFLTEGRIFGWCAAALQAAARAFDLALASGRSPEQAAHDKFNSAREDIPWEKLETLGAQIVEKRREGHAVTLGGLSQICVDLPGLSSISDSLGLTLNDPEFAARLEAANALALAPQMQAPAPAAALAMPTFSPAPAPGPGPGLGGGARVVRSARKPVHRAASATSAARQEGDKERAT